jgi:hypothetical protein
MSTVQPAGRPGVPTTSSDQVIHRRLIAEGVNRLNQGHMNASLYVTLDPGETETVVVDSRISRQTALIFHPQTADAAAALGTTYAVCTNGSATIYHTSNAQTDRKFTLGLIG